MEDEYLRLLKKFYPFDRDSSRLLEEDKAPNLVKKILADIREEKGLTYVGAYEALEIVYKFLKQESNFVSVKQDRQ